MHLVAHRGWPARHPENTLEGFEAALRAGARFVETDVQLSRDHVPVLFHDRTLAPALAMEGAVHDRRASELPGVPTLAAFCALLRAHPGATAFVEIKRVAAEHSGVATALDRALAPLDPKRAVVISFSREVVDAARARGWPRTGLVVEAWEEDASGADFVFCDTEILPEGGDLRREAALAVYDVVDPAAARALAARGAEYVETFAIGEMLAALPEAR